MLFRYILGKMLGTEKTVEIAQALALYEYLVLKNKYFKGPLPKALYDYFAENLEELNFDEWENIPAFLYEYSYGFTRYNDEVSPYPPVYGQFIRSLSTEFIENLHNY